MCQWHVPALGNIAAPIMVICRANQTQPAWHDVQHPPTPTNGTFQHRPIHNSNKHNAQHPTVALCSTKQFNSNQWHFPAPTKHNQHTPKQTGTHDNDHSSSTLQHQPIAICSTMALKQVLRLFNQHSPALMALSSSNFISDSDSEISPHPWFRLDQWSPDKKLISPSPAN